MEKTKYITELDRDILNEYSVAMVDVISKAREVGMSVIRSARSLEDALSTVDNGDEVAELILTSYKIRDDQKRLLEELARRNAETQATILRAIIDEWVEQKLRGGRQ